MPLPEIRPVLALVGPFLHPIAGAAWAGAAISALQSFERGSGILRSSSQATVAAPPDPPLSQNEPVALMPGLPNPARERSMKADVLLEPNPKRRRELQERLTKYDGMTAGCYRCRSLAPLGSADPASNPMSAAR